MARKPTGEGKTFTIQSSSVPERLELFKEICVLQALDPEKELTKLKIDTKKKGQTFVNLDHLFIFFSSLKLKGSFDFEKKEIRVSVERLEVTGPDVAKNPKSIPDTSVDEKKEGSDDGPPLLKEEEDDDDLPF